MLGEVAVLTRFSSGRGKRIGVHQFGVFTRGPFDDYSENEVKVVVGIHPMAVGAWRTKGLGLTGGRLEVIIACGRIQEMGGTVSERGLNGPWSYRCLAGRGFRRIGMRYLVACRRRRFEAVG